MNVTTPAKEPLQPGAEAPGFTLPAEPGGTITLADLRGAPVVLFFYPRDNTPGCTSEAKGFTALAGAFEAAGAHVLGISRDSLRKHANFRAKHELSVTLLSDEDGAVCAAYGAWGPKMLYGRAFEGIRRTTFLIGPDGRIAKTWEKVRVAGHAEEVLEALNEVCPR